MSPTLVPVDPLAEPGWDDLVMTHPAGSFFHTAGWARILSNSYGYRPFYFAAKQDDHLVGLIPFMEIQSWITGTRGVSLPFSDECEIFLPEGMGFNEAVQTINDFAKSRRWKTFEFRAHVPGMEGLPTSAEYFTQELDLSVDEKMLFSKLRSNVQRNIRKAEKEGVAILREMSSANLREFYRLNCITRREHGLPPQPYRFFENLGKHILSKRKGTLLLARYQKDMVAGAIFLHHGGNAIYKYGASDKRFQYLRANNLIMWEAIRYYSGQGFRIFSFGRTDMDHDGLRQFKLSWGSSERMVRYYKYDMESGSWSQKKKSPDTFLKNVFFRLPLPLLRAAGKIAYRHIG